MIKTMTCHWAVCDECGRDDFNGDFTEHYDSEAQAIEGLTENDGYVDPVTGQHLCWNCRDLPHALRPADVDPECCARCDEAAIRHPDKDPSYVELAAKS